MPTAVLTEPPCLWTVTLEDGTQRLVDTGLADSSEAAAVAAIVEEQAALALALATARAAAEAEVCAAVDAAGDAIAGRYPRTERDTWAQQEVAARAFAADPAGVSPDGLALLGAISQTRGVPVAELVPTIVAKADAWRAIGGALAGVRGAAFEAIWAAGTEAGVAAAVAAAKATITAIWTAAEGSAPAEPV
jgi:hypothetical protein